jgi:DegV family protein with EDD domain
MTVRILTDSTCDLPAEVINRLGIYVLPLYIHIGNRDFLDGIDISREEFYKNLPSYPIHPTTAVPSPTKFAVMYDALAGEGATEILSIHISSSLSAIPNVAQTAAKETTSVPVTVLDSRQLSLGTGFLVQTAAELAKLGKSVAEILPVLEDQIKRTYVAAGLDTLKFLRRSGRMNRVISTIGELIQLKPILKMEDGVSGVEKVRTRQKAIARMVEMIKAHSPFEKLAFLHSTAFESMHRFMEEVREYFPKDEIYTETINPVIGAHIGPGVVGFAGVSNK